METFKKLNKPEPVSAQVVTELVTSGRAGELVELTRKYEEDMKAYEEQQRKLRSGEIKVQRVCCKPNKKGNLYIQHPSIGTNNHDMNFNGLVEPAVKAIVFNEELYTMVKRYFEEREYVEEYYILE